MSRLWRGRSSSWSSSSLSDEEEAESSLEVESSLGLESSWPTRASQASSVEDSRSAGREALKFVFLASVIVTLILLSEEVGRVVLSLQSAMSRAVPLGWGVVLMVVASCPRRVALPAPYVFPFSTLALLYLVDKVGWIRAGVVFQAVLGMDSVWFLLVRRWWKPFMAALTDPDDATSRRCVPRDLLRALNTLDNEWGHRIRPMTAESFLSVVLLGTAWATDEQMTLYFLSTRFDLAWSFFAASWTAGLVVRLPETLVRARAIQIIAEDFASVNALRRGLEDTPRWLLVLWASIAAVATLVVHAVHAQIVVDWTTGASGDTTQKNNNPKRTSFSSWGAAAPAAVSVPPPCSSSASSSRRFVAQRSSRASSSSKQHKNNNNNKRERSRRQRERHFKKNRRSSPAVVEEEEQNTPGQGRPTLSHRDASDASVDATSPCGGEVRIAPSASLAAVEDRERRRQHLKATMRFDLDTKLPDAHDDQDDEDEDNDDAHNDETPPAVDEEKPGGGAPHDHYALEIDHGGE
eukprot:CAMPEP_0118890038 /NCGR_PEP_ID=MMETSP1166-20130328/695_1 /TAXON_ID=1104430 /ORGANISM="Chrysoreinhardia sp, Strain CCMP3193" /LENGTH=520 /DNA_ID=CAMNT_0006828639 /DNA_START=464 /DNA_END=2026 /DNA_ORIENTATION=-